MVNLGPLSVRQRREWSKKLMEAQEGVESSVDTRREVMRAARDAGMSFAAIEAATGLGPHTVRNNINGQSDVEL